MNEKLNDDLHLLLQNLDENYNDRKRFKSELSAASIDNILNISMVSAVKYKDIEHHSNLPPFDHNFL